MLQPQIEQVQGHQEHVHGNLPNEGLFDVLGHLVHLQGEEGDTHCDL